MKEVEVKVLNVDPSNVAQKLEKKGAKLEEKILLKVWWYCYPEDKNGPWPWFLRVRTYNDSKVEVTWKPIEKLQTNTRSLEEVSFTVSNIEGITSLFSNLNLVEYAYQEKKRTTYYLEDWRFDIDEYPTIPAYVEIEGRDDAHVTEAISLLDLADKKTWIKGERLLIDEVYGIDWFDMRF